MTKSPFLESIRAEGRKEGIKEGRAEDRAEAIVQLLQSKFSGQTPTDVLRRIEQNRNLEQLQLWFGEALVAGNLEEFLQRASLS